MSDTISLAPNLSALLVSTGELEKVVAWEVGFGRSGVVDEKKVRIYSYDVLLTKGRKGEFTYYRHASPPISLYKREYKGPRPAGYEDIYPDAKEVHLVDIHGEGRKGEFTEIPFP